MGKRKQEDTLEERIQDALDLALTDVVSRLAPMLTVKGVTALDLGTRFHQMVGTHLLEELRIIGEGPEGDDWGELSDQTQVVMYALGLELVAKKKGVSR